MQNSDYQAPSIEIIFVESDLISVSGISGKNPDLGEWDTEM